MARDRASRPEAKPLRLFVAVEVPSACATALAEAVEPLRERFPRARWVPPQNQHVTVKFLGSTYPRLVEWVTETRLGRRPRSTRPSRPASRVSARSRTLAGPASCGPDSTMPAGGSNGLAADLDEALAREFTPEKRAFTPHLTVARFDPSVGLEPLEVAFESEPFEIDRIVLFRSHLRRPAPVYEPHSAICFPLAAMRAPRARRDRSDAGELLDLEHLFE